MGLHKLRKLCVFTVLDGPLEHVGELRLVAEEVGPHPVDHAPVLHQVVLQRVAGQHHPPPGADLLQSLQKILGEKSKIFHTSTLEICLCFDYILGLATTFHNLKGLKTDEEMVY